MDAAHPVSDVSAWRSELRARLGAERGPSASESRRCDERIAEFLVYGFPLLRCLTIAFCWPLKGEVDARPAIHRFRAQGARTALPVLARGGSALEFREWTSSVAVQAGAFDLPVPRSRTVVPEALLLPALGIDEHGYRLGRGDGLFDRTLAGLSPQPLKIGLAREACRVDSIRPQAHDIPMDFIVTEAGVWEVGGSGLRRIAESSDVNARALEIQEARRTMLDAELTSLLAALFEAERAGAKLANACLDDVALAPDARARLIAIQRDESRNSAVLLRLLRRVRAEPSAGNGEFVQMALAMRDVGARLEFLNRCQAWVVERIACALPRVADAVIRDEMRRMHESHVANIDACGDILGALSKERWGWKTACGGSDKVSDNMGANA
jgi:5-formyltetrahydrofolate cyclo-ligase